MTSGNFSVDIGLDREQPEFQTNEMPNAANYLSTLQNAIQPTVNVPERASQGIDLASFGLHNIEEYDMMVNIKETGGTEQDFNEILAQVRADKDVGVAAGEGIRNIAGNFKFDSNVDDGVVESGGKFLANVPANLVQIGGDIITVASDPVGTLTSVRDLAEGLSDKLVFGTLNSIFGTDVTDTENAVMVEAIGGELQKLATEPGGIKRVLVENPGDVLLAVTGGLGVAKNVARSKNLTGLASKLEKAQKLTNPLNVLKAESKLITEPIKAVSKVAGQGVVKTTGLNLDTVKTIVKNPELFSKAEKGTLTRQTVADEVIGAIDKKASQISDIGTEYNAIRATKSNILPDDINKLKTNIQTKLSESDIVVDANGKLNFDNSQIGQTGNRKAIQDAYDLIQKRSKFDEGGDFLNLRQSVDDTINFKSDASTRGEKIVREIRGEIDNMAKDKLKGLKELDARFAPEREEFNRIQKLIRNKDGSLKDNYISTIANITGKGKELKLDRIKKILPNVEAQVNALKALEDVELAKGLKVGGYLGASAIGVGAVSGGIPGAVAAYIVTHPTTLVNVLKAYTGSQSVINTIVNKVKTGVKLSKAEAKVVGVAIKDQAIEKGGKLVDDFADKVGARTKLVDDSKDFSKAGTAKSADKFSFGTKNLPHGLTRADIDEIGKYTNWGYKGSSSPTSLNKVLDKLPNYDGFVFRKDNVNINDFVKGDTYSFNKPLSSTKNVDVLDNFKGNTEFTIKSSIGKDISKFSDIPAEGEVLFNSNAKFKIGGIIKSRDGANIIELTQIK